jgi:dsRNA-specific ribonuclease
MSTLPPLPKIDGDVDLMLDVYTHFSLRATARMNETYGDVLRLEQLGSKVLDLAVTIHLFNERPPLNTAEEIRAS